MKTETMPDTDVTQFSRQQSRAFGLAATTQDEIRQARRMLQEWQAAHPEEPKMPDVFEQFYMLEDAWRTLAAEPAEPAERAA